MCYPFLPFFVKVEKPYQSLFSVACGAEFFSSTRIQETGRADTVVTSRYTFRYIQSELLTVMAGRTYHCTLIKRIPALCEKEYSVSFTTIFFGERDAEKCIWVQPKMRDVEEALEICPLVENISHL